MLALRVDVFLVLGACAAACAGQDADAEEATENSAMDGSCPGGVLLQTKKLLQDSVGRSAQSAPLPRIFPKNLPLLETSQHAELDAKMQAADRVARLHGRNVPLAPREDIIWVHLHNFAGTAMCAEAMNQREYTPSQDQIPTPNCLAPGDMCSECANQRNCEQRTGYTFTAIERALTEWDLICRDKLYGTMLRDPVAGARSTFVNNLFDDDEKQRILYAIRNGGASVPAAKFHKCLPDWDTYQHFDNFATRTLSGRYSVPGGMMEMKHLEMAKARLQNMDVVLVLEELSDHYVQLEAFFGWNLTHGINETHNSHSQAALAQAFTKEEENFLITVNHLDFKLLAFGASLAANKSAAARVLLEERKRLGSS